MVASGGSGAGEHDPGVVSGGDRPSQANLARLRAGSAASTWWPRGATEAAALQIGPLRALGRPAYATLPAAMRSAGTGQSRASWGQSLPVTAAGSGAALMWGGAINAVRYFLLKDGRLYPSVVTRSSGRPEMPVVSARYTATEGY